MNINISEDISKLSNIPSGLISRLLELGELTISQSVYEMFINGEDSLEIDLSFGKILIINNNDELNYKFIPSNRLESSIINSISNNKGRLIKEAERSLEVRIINAYKELL